MKLATHCYAVTGLYFVPPWNVNAGFVVGSQNTLIVDSGSNSVSAQTIYGYANSIKPENELLLINTEKHLDHIGGNGYFSEKGITIYGHSSINRNQNEFSIMLDDINLGISNTVRRNKREGTIGFNNTIIVNPDKKFDREFEIDLGGICVQVILTPGHTKSNISVFQESEKVVYCGDCILPEFIPNLEEGNVPEWKLWLESLTKIQSLDPEFVVPGHGNVIAGKPNIESEIERIRQIITTAIKNNRAPTTIL
jgi:glyoxylase-like metal-dependent hydrolase (beta-lactamase superfamily II)